MLSTRALPSDSCHELPGLSLPLRLVDVALIGLWQHWLPAIDGHPVPWATTLPLGRFLGRRREGAEPVGGAEVEANAEVKVEVKVGAKFEARTEAEGLGLLEETPLV